VRRILLYTALGLFAVPVLAGDAAGRTQKGGKQPAATECSGDFGTSLHFLKTPSDAAKQAQKEEKLVFVLHVSGDFENPDFT
jgi:hypothetical protein